MGQYSIYNETEIMANRLLLILLLLTSVSIITAQDDIPLQGQLLALNTVEQDAILLYEVETGRIRTLSFGDEAHHVWDFSPDGCRLLFTLQEGTNPAQLYTARLDGHDVQAMVSYTEGDAVVWGAWEPQWSPMGDKIAFTMIRDRRQRDGTILREYHVGWIPAEGGEPTFYSVTGREHTPEWSPTGEFLAYVSYDERVAGDDLFSTAVPTPELPEGQPTPVPVLLNEADLWVVSADAETKYRLTNFQTGTISKPKWSPDGELVSFVYSPSNNNDMFWMIGSQQGSNSTQLTNQWSLILDTTWLPNSAAILGATRDFNDIGENRLWQIPLFLNSEAQATLYRQSLPIQHADYPRFSPDGTRLAVRSAYELMLINLQDNSFEMLPPETLGNTPAVWSPLAFNDERECQ